MSNKYCEENIQEQIQVKLDEIEKKEKVKILHAVESGSRSWGFASPDSDYDVRFIYVREKEHYLKLEDTKDMIDWELNEVLDINGWDLSKALKLCYKSNATIFEWANSPVVYRTTEQWNEIYSIAKNYFSIKATMYHYYGTAKSNYQTFLQEDYVKYKKYFYVLRPLLSCKWIEEKLCPPPVLFETLVSSMLEEDMKEVVQELLEVKKTMKESDKGKRIDRLNEYIETNLNYYKNEIDVKKDDRTKEGVNFPVSVM